MTLPNQSNDEKQQQNRAQAMRSDRKALWMLLAVVVLTAAVFLWSSGRYQQGDSAATATAVDAQGYLHVLGVTLGKTTLKQAEKILKSKSDVALYIYPQGHAKAGLKLEAFFPAIADHTKVVLLLDVNKATLKAIETRATIPHLYPDQVARMNLAVDDVSHARDATVSALTLIPNLVVSLATLKARFGEPDRVHKLPTGEKQYIYDAIGLKAVLHDDSPPMLHFTTPVALTIE